MADQEISLDPNLAAPAPGDLLAIVDISEPDATANKTITWSQITALGGGLSWVKKTTTYTMAAGEGVLALPAGTAFTVTIAATIAEGDEFVIHNANTSATAALITVARNGHTFRYQGTSVADDITLNDGETLHIIASDTTNMEVV